IRRIDEMSAPLARAALLCLSALAVVVGLSWWNPKGNYWKSVEPPKAQCEAYQSDRVRMPAVLSQDVYDPEKLNRLIREPQNTVSNLPYALAGLAILLAGRRLASFGLGLAGLFLGFGSGMYHASLLPEWRMIDILGVYAVLYSLLLIGVATRFKQLGEHRLAWVAVVATWLAAIYTGVHRNNLRWFGVKLFDSTYVFIAAVALGCLLAVLAYRHAANRKRYLKAMAVFVLSTSLSFAGGIGDRFDGFWAGPEFLIQGHAIWHTFGAVSLLAIYEAFSAAGFDRSVLQREIA
ncbi:MAG TPA: ceramidase domain-containing protein, partial [Lacunisphaera sp.]|nr:ceramidase domain-containing protein [Lacunisphaera sp.]